MTERELIKSLGDLKSMDDCISRRGVSAWLYNTGHKYMSDAVLDKNRFPSAHPAVVMCQNCKYAERPGHQNPGCKKDIGLGEWNDYCSRGEEINNGRIGI